jgi:periplasmic protein TonB
VLKIEIMKYLLQFEIEEDKKSKYWFPLFIDVDSQETADEKGKEIYSLLNNTFKKVSNYSINEYNSNVVSNKILEDYIKDEREGEFTLLSFKETIKIEDVDSNADRRVEFDKGFAFKNYDKELISYLDFGKKTILTRTLSDNINNFDEYLIIKLKRKAGFIRMDPKKNPKADLERLRGTILLGGLVVSFLIIYSMINFKFYDVQASELGQLVVEEEEEDIIPITEQNTPPPPPPPPPPPAPEILEIVEDDVEIEEEIDIDTEADAETVVEVFEVEEEVVEDEVFTIVESMPSFPGGAEAMFKFLNKNTKFPPAAKANGIQGKVYVNFTVGKNGKIRDIKVLRSPHELLTKEAMRVVKAMPKWKAGKQRGKAVSVSFNLPISFTLK